LCVDPARFHRTGSNSRGRPPDPQRQPRLRPVVSGALLLIRAERRRRGSMSAQHAQAQELHVDHDPESGSGAHGVQPRSDNRVFGARVPPPRTSPAGATASLSTGSTTSMASAVPASSTARRNAIGVKKPSAPRQLTLL